MEIIHTTQSHFPVIESYRAGEIVIDGVPYHHAVCVHERIQTLPEDWQIAQLSAHDIHAAVQAGADVLIVGTGARQRFLSPTLMACAAQYGLGLECMNTAAACRTIMLLQSEGRLVFAWLSL